MSADKDEVQITISRDDRDVILLCLGISLGVMLERGDGDQARWLRRTLEIANKLGCNYKLPADSADGR